MNAKGKVFRYGDNVDTDVIIPARYADSSLDVLSRPCSHSLCLLPSFPQVKPVGYSAGGRSPDTREGFTVGSSSKLKYTSPTPYTPSRASGDRAPDA